MSREVHGESELFMSLVCEVRIWQEIRLEVPRGKVPLRLANCTKVSGLHPEGNGELGKVW